MDARPAFSLSPPSKLPGLLLLIFLASGCTSVEQYVNNGFKVGPNYGKPPAPVATDWLDAADKRVRRESEEHRVWWKVFNDPVLDTLVCAAYQQNLTLRQAGFRIMQARAAAAIARGSLFPQQQAGLGSYSRNAVSRATANSFFVPERFFDNWETGFNLAWELDFWGRFRRAVDAADADLDASIENYDDVLVTLLGDAAASYVQMRTLQARIGLAQANVVLQRETLKIAQARFKAGQTSELDVDQSLSTLAQTEALIPLLEIQLRVVSNQLCILLGIPPEELQAKIGARAIPTAPPEVAVGIPAELLTRRPDVRRAERLAAAQSEQIGIAESEFYPHIAVTGTIAWQAEKSSQLFKEKALAGSVGPSFQWNVLLYGRLLNNVRLQDARFQELIAAYQNTVLGANAEVENGLVTFLKSQERARYLGDSVAAAEKAVKIALAQYKAGQVDYNRVAFLEQNLVAQQDQWTQAQGDIAIGLIQTYRALGGGWQIRLDGCQSTPLPLAGGAKQGPKPGEILPNPMRWPPEQAQKYSAYPLVKAAAKQFPHRETTQEPPLASAPWPIVHVPLPPHTQGVPREFPAQTRAASVPLPHQPRLGALQPEIQPAADRTLPIGHRAALGSPLQ